MRWQEYLVKRLFLLVPILLVVSVLIFSLIHLTPGDPARAILGQQATQEAIKNVDKSLGLDKPLVVQYFDWISGIVTGDLGQSYTYSKPVSSVLISGFFRTFELLVLMLVFSTVVSIPLGIIAALRHQTYLDYATMGIGVVGVGVPMFVSGVLLVLLFSIWVNIFPTSGFVPLSDGIIANLRYMVLPTITLSFGSIAVIVRSLRSSMLETLSQDYIRFLKAKGLSRRLVLFRHVLKNSFIPVITLVGLRFGYMLSSAIVVEQIFAIPGIGRIIVQATLQRDYPLIQGALLLLAVWFTVVNLLTDISISFLDPRITEEAE